MLEIKNIKKKLFRDYPKRKVEPNKVDLEKLKRIV